jgi:V/A-type H+/Na+-transporting ATPase subunit D
MPKIKLTKNELKTQRDALKRFTRYVPTLQLKKQQLQLEVRNVETALEAKRAEEASARQRLTRWVKLFSEPVEFERWIRPRGVRTSTGNIAGVAIPVFEGLEIERETPDLFDTPAWLDDGLDMLETLLRLDAERQVLEAQRHALAEELRVTNQRVNLFEKVKIPQAKEGIRVIRIFLGDQQTAGVARAKLAKGRTTERTSAA